METELPMIREQNNNNNNNKRSVQGFCEGLELYHAVACVCVAFNAILAMYMSRDSLWDLVSIITGCASLIWQFLCLKWNEMMMSQGADACPRWMWDLFKVVLWVMATLLAVSFAARVSQTVPLCLMIVVWSTSAYVTVAGIYWSFLILSKNVYEGANKKCDSIVEKEKEHQSAHDLQLDLETV